MSIIHLKKQNISASINFTEKEVLLLKHIFLVFLSIALLVVNTVVCGEKPAISAQSAILIDRNSKRILFSYQPYIKLPMASTTKIMTALIALENGNINDLVTIKKNSVGIEGSSIYLAEGETLTLEDLLYGLMLRSGNDSAMAIANHIGNDLESFVELMNGKAREIGAINTNFVNPHGLYADNHYTTAYDLALITAEALEIEKFQEIVSTKTWRANRNKNNIFYNKNKTLWEYPGGDGVKTGYTIMSGRCLVTSATKNNIQLIAVVLNASNWFNDCYKLMDYGFENFKNYVIYEEGKFFKNIPVINGEKEIIPAIAKRTFLYPLKEEELEKVKLNIKLPNYLEAPINKGDEIGDITVYLDGQIIHKDRIIAKENIDQLSIIKRIIRRFRD